MPDQKLDPLTWPEMGVYWSDSVDVYHSHRGQVPLVVDPWYGGVFITRNGNDTYGTNATGSGIWKNGQFFLGSYTQLQGISSNSRELFVVDINNAGTIATCYVYSHSGSLQRTFQVAPAMYNFGGRVNIAANETHVIATCNEHGYIYTVAGALVGSVSVPNISYQEQIAISHDRAYFMTYDGGYAYQVYSLTGTSLGTVAVAYDSSTDYPTAIEVTREGLWMLSARAPGVDWINTITFWPKAATGEGFDTPYQQGVSTITLASATDMSRDRGRAVT
jgi:hypothetical protein